MPIKLSGNNETKNLRTSKKASAGHPSGQCKGKFIHFCFRKTQKNYVFFTWKGQNGVKRFLEDQRGNKSTCICPHKYRNVSEIYYFIARLTYFSIGFFLGSRFYEDFTGKQNPDNSLYWFLSGVSFHETLWLMYPRFSSIFVWNRSIWW